MLNLILWLPKHLLVAHYALFVHLTTPRGRFDEAEEKCDRLHQRLFGKTL